MAEAGSGWEPALVERVLLVATGETGTILRMSSTEWGLLCDIQFEPLPASGAAPRRVSRRVHAATELRPLDG